MASTDSEGAGYDDDEFEEVSEDDFLQKSVKATDVPKKAPGAKAPLVPEALPVADLTGSDGAPLRMLSQSRDSVRPSAADPCDSALGAPPETLIRAGSSSSAGRRLVRGKVSVGPGADADGRPGSGDSSSAGRRRESSSAGNPGGVSAPAWLQPQSGGRECASGGGTPSAANSKPGWLQREGRPHGEPKHGSPGRQLGSRNRGANGGEPPLLPDYPGSGGGASASAAGRRVPGGGSRAPDTGLSDDDRGRAGTADDAGDQRKVKRLQQEIQRLTQRLSEADRYSSAEDGVPKFVLEEVEIGSQIAQGGFSSVHHALWHHTPCALKKIFDPVITEELRSEFENEVRMLRRLRHPHVVTLMAICRVPPALSILTEFIGGGSLFDLLHGAPSHDRAGPECEPAALLPVVQQAAVAVAYLHAMLVIHRDIKSQNVLLTEGQRPVAKLCDFGLARMRSELCTGTMQWAGTPTYMAPELFARRRYNEAVDVFAFGTMLWEVVSAEIPHANLDPADIAHRVQHKDCAGLSVTHSWPKSFKGLLRSMLAVQPESRPTMNEAVKQLSIIVLEFPSS